MYIINISTPLLVLFDSSLLSLSIIISSASSSFLSALSFLYVSLLISVFSLSSSFPFSLSLFLLLPHFPFFLSQTFTSYLTYHHSSHSILFLSRNLQQYSFTVYLHPNLFRTIQYNISIKLSVNQRMTKKVVLKEYCAEIETLKSQLQLTREKNGYVPYLLQSYILFLCIVSADFLLFKDIFFFFHFLILS